MPKKFRSENTKAAQARERKETLKNEIFEKKQKASDDAYWADDDKYGQRKQQRKDEKEKKRLEQLERKKELAMLADEEMESLKGAKPKAQPSNKVSRAQIQAHEEEEQHKAAAAKQKETQKTLTDMPLEENINRLRVEGDEARTVEDAISVLSINEPGADRHPEKRMKAAFQKFEEDYLPQLKKENPNMRLSQLKQILKKDWMKSPENPLNQNFEIYNAKR